MPRLLTHLLAVAMVFPAHIAQSSDLLQSDEDILLRWQEQQRLSNSSTDLGSSRGLTGDNRGLVIVTSTTADQSAAEAASNPAAAAEASATPTQKADAIFRFDETLSVDVRVQFALDSASLSQSQQPALEQICRVMQRAESISLFRIVGHTDSNGTEAYNESLSLRRAEEVGRHLVENCGIARDRLETVGYGERFPDNPEDPTGAENRRVEFQAIG
ncbi:MAG: OmpA family protein [Pseudomonadota bacterium]